ncbi:DUF1659 domain-containing protein [Clostridium beijerinckii]|uniref:DUF1659 domain-containing protein n=1 Tax=Clostridium beijerinckii TaxID=1520 RepID=A0AB74VBZ0_CLOBE|nr:hypothetical protein [Clostridium beijerinckii]NYB96020.1 hypothetical protein [Clostridium beijerinckii]OOM19760.1 hypothetical protein CLBEI_48340 [Clostridium beijerinckii]QUN33934.1 DUF1659 domain-containing protein [Clostridium beijerinckii]SQB01157.1 Uncharacterised protein [Clostridium beijerinckii]
MAVTKTIDSVSLSIEVEKGVDKTGDPIYTKSATCCYLKRIA